MTPKNIFKEIDRSVITVIGGSVFTIIVVMMIATFGSFWMVERMGLDAKTINISGSLRMQTYRVEVLLQQNRTEELQLAIDELDTTWNDHALQTFMHTSRSDDIHSQFQEALHNWEHILKPKILRLSASSDSIDTLAMRDIIQDFDAQVSQIDVLVDRFQIMSELKTNRLRLVLISSLFLSIVIGFLIFYVMKFRLEQPLKQLTTAAKEIGEGKLDQHLTSKHDDELALLADTLNTTSHAIAEMRDNMQETIDAKTQKLLRNNLALNFLFNIASTINHSISKDIDIDKIVSDLSIITEIKELQLCLFTPEGNTPYLSTATLAQCEKENCRGCRIEEKETSDDIKFPILYNGVQQGVLVVNNEAIPLDDWKDHLIQAVADQVGVALSIKEQGNTDRRIALMAERSVIARELHDSIAQALSYLQIQVSRIQKMHDNKDYEKQQAVIDELREGLSSAYQNLRDLLTTFRLKMSDEGFHKSLLAIIEQVQDRTNMSIHLDFDQHDIPLSPAEEIHMVQIIREAIQNAIKHSQGKNIYVTIHQKPDKTVLLSVMDDGIGLPEKPEKLNHYGLAIMQERNRHLSGDIQITSTPNEGTTVSIQFLPTIIAKSA